MFVLSLLKKTAQPTEYYFDTFEKPHAVLLDIKSSKDPVYFQDDYGQSVVIRPDELAESAVIDAERRKMALHELRMIDDDVKVKIQKSILADPRTSEIMKLQQPVNQNEAAT